MRTNVRRKILQIVYSVALLMVATPVLSHANEKPSVETNSLVNSSDYSYHATIGSGFEVRRVGETGYIIKARGVKEFLGVPFDLEKNKPINLSTKKFLDTWRRKEIKTEEERPVASLIFFKEGSPQVLAFALKNAELESNGDLHIEGTPVESSAEDKEGVFESKEGIKVSKAAKLFIGHF